MCTQPCLESRYPGGGVHTFLRGVQLLHQAADAQEAGEPVLQQAAHALRLQGRRPGDVPLRQLQAHLQQGRLPAAWVLLHLWGTIM